ncbi:MAG: restriction endonuclease subunit S [Methanobacteriaceae archaeon]|nr:restriction endonuclease subunit S [Methanobacteriaceae archaeon]MDP3484383.1 restriction endonuclease subunit S [Methanobacteriaceae archaeon]MDP3624842.1 restriction endonuclease subunit S [Methanobacteriaceae archaeon]
MLQEKTEFKETAVGFIPEEWKLVKIDDIKSKKRSSIAMGPFGSNITKDNFIESGVPVIRGGNFSDFKFAEKDFVYLSEEKADELKSSNVFPKDIILTHRGTLGQVGIIPENSKYPRYVVSQSQMKLTCDENKINPFYLFYFLKSKMGQHLFLMNASQTGVPAIARPTSSLKEIMVPLPTLSEQKSIVDVLKSITDKIEINQKMNQTLEEIGQAIFKQWFVHFEFPNEEGKPYKSSGGEMVDSELGEIPNGWEVVKIAELIELVYGKGLTKNKRKSGEIPVYGSNGITDYHNESFVRGPGLIIGRKGTVGKIHISYDDFWPIDTTYFVKSKIDSIIFFWYYLLNSLNLEKMNVHSAVPGLNRNDIYYLLVLKPKFNVLLDVEIQLKSLFDKINQNNLENENLSQIRDSLLPKLMSGKIRVNGDKNEIFS